MEVDKAKVIQVIKQLEITVSKSAEVKKRYQFDEDLQELKIVSVDLQGEDDESGIFVTMGGYHHNTVMFACYDWDRRFEQMKLIKRLSQYHNLNVDEIRFFFKCLKLQYDEISSVNGTEMSLDERLTHSNDLVRITAQIEHERSFKNA